MLDSEEILNALTFYEINDYNYINNCYECIKTINESSLLLEKVKQIYIKLYSDNSNLKALWKIKNLEDIFGKDYPPFISNILLLLGYKYHLKNINKYNLDEKQISIHKKRVKECLVNDIYGRKLSAIRLSQLLWGVYFIKIKLIEVGRLQYEYYQDEVNKCIKIHIPLGIKLEYNDVVESLRNSKKELSKYFDLSNCNYYCSSWLLSKEIYILLDRNSNISKFQTLFDISKGDNCIDDIFNFVYGISECRDLNKLEERTSLQKSIKTYLLQGNQIYLGIGKLKEEFKL